MLNTLYTWLLLLCATLLTGCGKQITSSAVSITSSAVSNWTPPQNPNLMEISREAEADATAGNYADALAKHVWLFQNALKFDPSFVGVRVADELASWVRLSAVYPPALDKLKAVRDEAAENVRQGNDAVNEFQDFAAINNDLKEYGKTAELFIWIDANKPAFAKAAFANQYLLVPALVKAKEFHLCGKYIDANAYFKQSLECYRTTAALGSNRPPFKAFRNIAKKDFINQTTMLIAILVVNDRKVEAQQIVDKISKESDLPEFKTEIQNALSGELPTQLP